MQHTQASKLKKYVNQFVDRSKCAVRVHRTDEYNGGFCVRVYDNETGSIIEVGNPNRSSIRSLVTFAKYGDM